MVDAGHMALVTALLVAAYAAAASLIGAPLRIPQLTASGRFGLYTVPPLLLVATLGVVYAFVTRDFSVRYVAENSNLAMPKVYTWVAFYAGNAGSLLYLALVVSVMSAKTFRYTRSSLLPDQPIYVDVVSPPTARMPLLFHPCTRGQE